MTTNADYLGHHIAASVQGIASLTDTQRAELIITLAVDLDAAGVLAWRDQVEAIKTIAAMVDSRRRTAKAPPGPRRAPDVHPHKTTPEAE